MLLVSSYRQQWQPAVLNLLSTSVAKNQHFCPCRKKLCVGSKNE